MFGVLRMDDDLADLERLLQAHVLPGLAAVGGLVDAVAVGDGVARVVLAGADPDDVPDRTGRRRRRRWRRWLSWSNWCSKVMPLLMVLSSPPDAVATQ